jgi:multidrug efflux pump subunit AcrA (membrane-fusion protein)
MLWKDMKSYKLSMGVCLFLSSCLIYFIMTMHDSSVSAQEKIIASQATSKKAVTSSEKDSYKGYIECSGKIQPQHTFSPRLRPGERIVRYMVQKGNKVKKGAPLVKLANDNLLGERELLLTKEGEIEEYKDQIGLLKLKIELANKSIESLKRQITEESKIKSEIPEYLIEGKLREWIDEVKRKEDSLEIMQRELSIYEKRIDILLPLAKARSDRLADINAQLENLLIRAPFAGQVQQINPYFQNLGPGELILEVWDNHSLQVEATVWQHQLPHVAPGNRVKIFPDFFRNSFFWGKVRSVGSSGLPAKEDGFTVFPVIVDIDQSSVGLVPGMAVTVRITGSKDVLPK